MSFAPNATEDTRSLMAAAIHVDGSARIQTVEEKTMPEYWNILNEKKQNKGYIIFDTETEEHQFYSVKTRKQIFVQYEI